MTSSAVPMILPLSAPRVKPCASVGVGHFLALMLAAALFLLSSASADSVNGRTPFTVRDSIEMNRVIPFRNEWQASPASGVALFSPDREHFVIHVRRGDLTANRNRESLLLFDCKKLEAYLSGQQPIELVVRQVTKDWGEVSSVVWTSNSEIAFTAEDLRGISQIYAVDVNSRQVTQVTRSRTNVRGFAISQDQVVYFSVASDEVGDALVVGHRTVDELLSRDTWIHQRFFPRLEVWKLSRTTGSSTRLSMPTMRLVEPFQRIWLSPSGGSAVLIGPATDLPAHWGEYVLPDGRSLWSPTNEDDRDSVSSDLQFRVRYYIADLRSGSVRPLLDAPLGWPSNYSISGAFWMKDEKSVVVANSFMPLDRTSGQERERRRSEPAIVEVEPATGRTQLVAWEPVASNDEGRRSIAIDEISWDSGTSGLTLLKSSASAESQGAVSEPVSAYIERYLKHSDQWKGKRVGNASSSLSTLAVTIRQHLNERPNLVVYLEDCKCQRVVYDPNPRADAFTFGHASMLEWKDQNDISWRGALIKPPDWTEDRLYPLVIQTHGFQPTEFLIDGPYGVTTAFAAQAFANSGFMVLQVEDNVDAETEDMRAGFRYEAGIRAAIEKLVHDRLVDSTRVGIIGWSRTAFHALYLLSNNPKMFAAATLADGMQAGYVGHMLDVNASRDFIRQVQESVGGPPVIGSLDQWTGRHPLYALPHSLTPLRIEANGPYSLLTMWETYALMKYADKPVEMIYFPAGSHVLTKPRERLASQQGNVEWFQFWLQDKTSGDIAKRQQYADWQRMRARHQSFLSTSDEGSSTLAH